MWKYKNIFQPAEETKLGEQKQMIDEGYFTKSSNVGLYIISCMPYLDVGKIQLKQGKMNAATNEFSIKIKGVNPVMQLTSRNQ